MSNQLEKLKNSINKEYVNQFELNLMKTSGFIPVDKRQNNFYVIINKSLSKNKNSISEKIQETLGSLNPQFIPVEQSEFDEIYREINSNANSEGKSEQVKEDVSQSEKPENDLSPEDMLVGIGWLTSEQLREAQKLSIERGIPLDGIFFEKEFLTPDKIASYLQKKYGYKVLSKSAINVDKSILKMLPDDFVERKKAIILSMEEGNKLGVDLLRPDD